MNAKFSDNMPEKNMTLCPKKTKESLKKIIDKGIIKQLKKIIVSMLENREGNKYKNYYESVENSAETKRWKEVLNKIAEYAPHQHAYKVDENHELLQKLKMSKLELDLCLSFLEDNELIKNIEKTGGYGSIGLTKKGFDISFEIKKIKSEEHFRKNSFIISLSAIILSAVLAIVNIYKILT